MKKILKTFILAMCLILPGLLCLTACGGGKEPAKVLNFSVELANTSYTIVDDTITVAYGKDYRLSFSDFSVIATFDDETSKTLTSDELEDFGFTFSSTIPNSEITPVGEYAITFGNENLTENDFKTIKINVEKKTVDVNALNLTWTNVVSPIVYNGQAQRVEITNLPEYLEATYYNNVETVPNTYYAVASIKIKDSFADRYVIENNEVSVPNKWIIEKATIAVPNVREVMENYTYDGNAKDAKIKDEIKVQLESLNISATLSGSTTETDANEYQVTITFKYTGDDVQCYNLGEEGLIGSDNATWTISPKEIDLSGVELKVKGGETYGNAFTYDGTEKDVVFDLSSLSAEGYINDNSYPIENGLPSTGIQILEFIATGTFSATNADEYDVAVTFSISSIFNYQQNYKFKDTEDSEVTISKTWKISKAELAIVVNNKINENALTYGDEVSYSESDVNVTGLVGGETLESLGSLSFAYSTAVDGIYSMVAPTDAGMYYVKVNTLNSNNYNISYTIGELEIKKATLTISTENKTYEYGSFGSGDVTIEGYKYDDETALEEEIKYALSTKIGKIVDENFVEHKTGKMVVGEYVYRMSGLDGLKNYTPNYIDGTMTITPCPLTITLNSKTGDSALTYGDTPSYSASDIVAVGLKYMETIESLGNIQVIYASSQTGAFDVTPKNAGTYYAKVAEFESNDANRNYTITYNVSELEIEKAVLIARVKDIDTVYGTYCPALEDEVTGFKYGEDKEKAGFHTGYYDNVLYEKDNPDKLVSKTRYANAGEYIYRPTFSMTNYTVELVYGPRGTYLIKPQEVSIEVKIEKSLVYGDELTADNIKYFGNKFPNKEWNNELYWGEITGTLSYTTTYTKGSPAGDYTISASGLTCTTGNYAIKYLETTFTVDTKEVFIKTIAQKMSYGKSVTLGESNVESISWVYDADSSIIGGQYSFEFKAEGTDVFTSRVPINAGNYKYRVKTDTYSSPNYTFIAKEADYIIDRIPIRITVGDATAKYGSDFSKLDISLTFGGRVYYNTLEKVYVDENLAITHTPEGEQLQENIIVIDTSLAYKNDESLFESIKKFKFGCFVNNEFEPYDSNSENMSIGIFLEIDQTVLGWETTVDNYIIVAEAGLLTITNE